ncbi:MAG: NADH-quinone oxidoreductase subunit M [Coriobacteriia bacterium]|nr:NADH-quinone oxidoreductase subunit M [Coriobacteriia bacterium]
MNAAAPLMGLPLLSIIALAPLVGALAIALFGGNPRAPRVIAFVSATVCLVSTVVVWTGYDRAIGGLQFIESVPWIESLGISYTLGVDGISIPMLALMSIVLFTGVLVSWDIDNRPREFFVLLLLLVTGVFGVFVAVDAFLLFFFYEMAVLPMYLLIAVWGSTRKDYSAMKLTLFLFAGSALLIVLLALVYWQVGLGTFDMRVWAAHGFSSGFQHWAFLLALVGFGTLIPIWPLHTWSPDGHVAAPTAVSMMHAGVLLKIGAYGVIRLGIALFPEGVSYWWMLVAVIGAINVVYGAFCAMSQTDLKYVIGYSSVSHMGYVLLGFSMASGAGAQWGLEGAVFQMFAHGMMTALFFALIGYVYEKTHTRKIAEISGLMERTPLVAAGFVVASAASMGIPSTSGFVAELLVYIGLIRTRPVFAAIAFVGVVITAGYLIRMLTSILLGEPSIAVKPLTDPRPLRALPIVMLALTIMAAGIFASPVYDTIASGVLPLVERLTGG